jgi:hypothetical protein
VQPTAGQLSMLERIRSVLAARPQPEERRSEAVASK